MPSDAHRQLIERLVADTRPVARLWSPAVRLALWVVLAATVFLGAALAGLRPDLTQRLHDASFWLEVAIACSAAIVLAALALRAAVPGREPRGGDIAIAAALVVSAMLFCFKLPVGADVGLAEFVGRGTGCVIRSVALAAIPWAALIAALRRGAPFAPATAGALAGGAAFVMAFAMMRLVCGLDEMLHIVVWHAGPILVGTAASTLAGVLWLSRWRRGLEPSSDAPRRAKV